jgi:hypothetical protein
MIVSAEIDLRRSTTGIGLMSDSAAFLSAQIASNVNSPRAIRLAVAQQADEIAFIVT